MEITLIPPNSLSLLILEISICSFLIFKLWLSPKHTWHPPSSLCSHPYRLCFLPVHLHYSNGLIWLVPYLYLSPHLPLPYTTISDFQNINLMTLPLSPSTKALRWLPIALRINTKSSTWPQGVLHDLAPAHLSNFILDHALPSCQPHSDHILLSLATGPLNMQLPLSRKFFTSLFT